MMMMSSPNSWLTVHRTLAQRCTTLGVPAWACDEMGAIVEEPAEPAPLRPWLSSPRLRDMISKAVAALIAQPNPPDGEETRTCLPLFPGCSLIVIQHKEGSRIVGRTVAVALLESALKVDECAAIAAAAEGQSAALEAARSLVLRDDREIGRLNEMLQWTGADVARMQREQDTLLQFGEKLVQAYEETNMLFRFARSLNCVQDPHQLMSLICHQLQQTLPLRWVAVRFRQNQKSRSVPDLSGKLIIAGDLPCDEAVFDRHALDLLEGWGESDWTRLLEPQRHPLAKLVNAEVLAEQITHDNVVVGMLLAGNRLGDEDELSSAEMQFIDAASDFLGVFHENLARFSEQRTLFTGTVQALTAAIDAKDSYTRGHSERVALLSRQLAAALGLDRQAVEQMHIAGLVHDVGKIGVPEAVLRKPGHLSESEFEMIKRHPRIGYDILKDIATLAPMLPGVLHHHERWDGSGYPLGLSGEVIPLVGRILAMADAFDAMSSNRSYRPAMSRPRVFDEIRRCSGSQFDPAIAEVFLTLNFDEFDAMLVKHYGQTRHAA